MPKIKKHMTKVCEFDECERIPRYGFDDDIVCRCSDHREEGMLDQRNVRCQAEGCTTQASFGLFKKKPLFCNKHKEDGMVNVWNKMCAHEGCTKTVNFGYEDKKPTHCGDHKKEDMKDVSHKLCEDEGCSVRACWGLIEQVPFLCSKHGRNYPLAMNVVTGRCEFIGCQKIPSFALPGEQRTFCKEHKTEEMSYAGMTCVAEDCSKQPNFGWDGGSATFCAEHQIPGMILIYHRPCRASNCNITASYGYENEAMLWCAFHGKLQEPKAVLLNGKRCEHPECSIAAAFGMPGSERRFCFKHKTNEMINVCEKRANCASCGLSYNLTGLNNMSLCCYCRADEETHRRKENVVAKLLKANIADFSFIRDSYRIDLLDKAQLRYRPDFWLHLDTHILVIEVDEQAHSGREPECEVGRMINIAMSCEGKPVVFIRYNPDGTKVPSKHRQSALVDTVKRNIHEVPQKLLTVEYMYYSDQKVAALERLTKSYLATYR